MALQLWLFLALVLDALAIAAQSLVGQALGAGLPRTAMMVARRVGQAGLLAGTVVAGCLLAGWTVIPRIFTSDPAVLEQVSVAWPWFVAMQPAAGLVFALDGVLVGAGDVRFLRDVTIVAGLAGFLPVVWFSYAAGLGLGGIWLGLAVFVLVRVVGMVVRVSRGRWATAGVTA